MCAKRRTSSGRSIDAEDAARGKRGEDGRAAISPHPNPPHHPPHPHPPPQPKTTHTHNKTKPPHQPSPNQHPPNPQTTTKTPTQPPTKPKKKKNTPKTTNITILHPHPPSHPPPPPPPQPCSVNSIVEETKKMARNPRRLREVLRPRRWRQFFSVLWFGARTGARWKPAADGEAFQQREYESYGEYVAHQQSKLQYLDHEEYDRNYRRVLGERLRALSRFEAGGECAVSRGAAGHGGRSRFWISAASRWELT